MVASDIGFVEKKFLWKNKNDLNNKLNQGWFMKAWLLILLFYCLNTFANSSINIEHTASIIDDGSIAKGIAGFDDVIALKNNLVIAHNIATSSLFLVHRNNNQWQVKEQIPGLFDYYEAAKLQKFTNDKVGIIARNGIFHTFSYDGNNQLKTEQFNLSTLISDNANSPISVADFRITQSHIYLLSMRGTLIDKLYIFSIVPNTLNISAVLDWKIPIEYGFVSNLAVVNNNVWLAADNALVELTFIDNQVSQKQFFALNDDEQAHKITATENLVLASRIKNYNQSGYFYIDLKANTPELLRNDNPQFNNPNQNDFIGFTHLYNSDFLAVYYNALIHIDFSDIHSPLSTTVYKTPESKFSNISFDDDRIYAAEMKQGFSVYTPDSLETGPIETIDFPSTTFRNINIAGNHVFLNKVSPSENNSLVVNLSELTNLNESQKDTLEGLTPQYQSNSCVAMDDKHYYSIESQSINVTSINNLSNSASYPFLFTDAVQFGHQNHNTCLITDDFLVVVDWRSRVTFFELSQFDLSKETTYSASKLIFLPSEQITLLAFSGEYLVAASRRGTVFVLTRGSDRWQAYNELDLSGYHAATNDFFVLNDIDIYDKKLLLTDNGHGNVLIFSLTDNFKYEGYLSGKTFNEQSTSALSTTTWKDYIIISGYKGFSIHKKIDSGFDKVKEITFSTSVLDIMSAEDTLFGIDDSSSLQVFKLSEADDNDADGLTNREDLDDDNDRFIDIRDAFPLDASEHTDTDNDGIGNNADTDDDNDGVTDDNDAFPLDASEHTDTDNDGIGNNADTDDDNDSVTDDNDAFPLDVTKWQDEPQNNAEKSSSGSMLIFLFVLLLLTLTRQQNLKFK